MPPTKVSRPATTPRMVQRQLIGDPQQAHRVSSDAIGAVETKLGKIQKLITNNPPAVTGSRGGNDALASLLSALAGLGLITDNTTS